MSPFDNSVWINGSRVDLTAVESTLIAALPHFLTSIKLVSSSATSPLALFFTSRHNVNELALLETVREILLAYPSFPKPLADMISFARQLTELPFDEGGVDVSMLRSIAEERWQPGTVRIASTYSPDSTPFLSFESSSHFSTAAANPPPMTLSSILGIRIPRRSRIAPGVASHTVGGSATPIQTRFSAAPTAPTWIADLSCSGTEFWSAYGGFDDIDLEAGVSEKSNINKHEVYTINPNPISYVFVSWITDLVWKGFKKPLTKDDLYDLNPIDSFAHLDGWISRFWHEYDSFCRQPSKGPPRLWGSMVQYARKFFVTSALLSFLSIVLGLFGSILNQQLIIAADVGSRPTTPEGEKMFDDAVKRVAGGIPLLTPTFWILVLFFFGTRVLQAILGRTSGNMIKNTSLNVKTALIAAIYKKISRLGPKGVGRFEKSYVLNLLNLDVDAISRAAELGNLIWSIPLQLCTAAYLFCHVLGFSTWAGIGIIPCVLLVLTSIVLLFFRTTAPMLAHFGDKRMKMINEIIKGMTLIKVRGWEGIFLRRLEAVRQAQLRCLRTFNTGVTVFAIVGQSVNTVVLMVALSLLGGAKGGITAARAFPAISSLFMSTEPLIVLPQFLSTCAIAVVSWRRIYSFLMTPEAAPVPSNVHLVNNDPIRISNGSFAWAKKVPAPAAHENPEKPKAFVHDINMSIKRGSLTAVVGPVGCGKSSLFAAILGGMDCVSGEVVKGGSIAYCSQQPWIQPVTVQDNITFGKPLETQRLNHAISAASFAADLERLPNGFASEIAEHGANLSGGQKARLSLARAIYADADIYLLDDPLAVLDPCVGRTVFQECFLDALHGKTRILVTHTLNFLPQVDHIIVLNNGTIAEQGSYAQLCRQDGQLRKMIDAVEKRTKDKNADKREATETEKTIKAEDAPSGNTVAGEGIPTGVINGSPRWSYIGAAGGWKTIVLFILFFLPQQAGTVAMNQWLAWWIAGKFQRKFWFWPGIYDSIGIATVLLMVVVGILILFSVFAASRTFHNKALSGIVGAPMEWFHVHPTGRIVSRLSRDMEIIDRRLMLQIFQAVVGLGLLISSVFILGRNSPVILGALVLLSVANWILFRPYLATLRALKHLAASMRFPFHSMVHQTLDGISTIAAFKREGDFASSIAHLIDNSNKPVYLYGAADTWFTLRLELLSALVVALIAMLGKTIRIVDTPQLGYNISRASAFTYIANLFIRAVATIEADMIPVERLREYTERLLKDATPHLLTDPVKGAWPSRGEIIFRGVEAAYPSRPKPVLKDVNIHIQPGTTVFIVGRTGSGKSTLLSVLVRLLELGKGNILVDGEDISKLGAHTLRRGIELIPQDPFIFSGTIRTALDFESRHEDASLWHALELVGLRDFVADQEDGLDTIVAVNGSNYSVGQRQLLCLAGSILRSPKILLLDGATASVDAGSDAFLHETMRANCPGATILSVLYRLGDWVLEECDYVLVMDEGTPAEFAPPKALMANPGSLFFRIMEAAK